MAFPPKGFPPAKGGAQSQTTPPQQMGPAQGVPGAGASQLKTQMASRNLRKKASSGPNMQGPSWPPKGQ